MITTEPAGCPVDPNFDPLGDEYLADPIAVLAGMPPQNHPLFYAPAIDYYVVTRWKEAEHVFRQPETFSAAAAQLPLVPLTQEAQEILRAVGHKPQPSMVSLDPPSHERLRRPAQRAFTPARVRAMVPTIQRTIEELLDSLESEHEFDLAGSLAHPLPASVIFALLGVPSENWSQLKQWCGFRAALSWGRPAPEEQIEIATNMASYRRYLFALVERKQRDRGDDLTSDLLAIHDEDPERLTLEEIASILFSLSFAGHETTSGLIGNTMRRLLEQPAAWAEVVADPKLSDAAVGETLRFDTSVPAWRRMVKEEVEIAGIRLPAGARIFIWLVAVNRDPGVFRNPDTFDLHREDAHLALSFGKGIHYCLGASLGRVEAAMAVAELARRYPSLRLRGGQALTFHPNISFRGPQSLWVEVSSQRRPPDGP